MTERPEERGASDLPLDPEGHVFSARDTRERPEERTVKTGPHPGATRSRKDVQNVVRHRARRNKMRDDVIHAFLHVAVLVIGAWLTYRALSWLERKLTGR